MPNTGQNGKNVQKQRGDRRRARTQNLLRGALHALIGEKPYDAIAVTDVLERADVGRSTFYTHFRDKDELFASTIREIVDTAQSRDRLSFSLPIFEYIEQHRSARQHHIRAKDGAILHERLRRALIDVIAETVNDELLVQFIASTFIVIFNWWLEQEHPCPSTEADAVFRDLVRPALRQRSDYPSTSSG